MPFIMDFSRSKKPLDFSKQKQDNANEIFLRTQSHYRQLNGEIAAIVCGNKTPEAIYDTNTFQLGIANDDYGYHKVIVGIVIDGFIEENRYEKGDLAVLIFHNHPQGTNFSVDDFMYLVKYECVYEMYIDTSNHVLYFRKHLGTKEEHKEKIYNEIFDIFADVSLLYLDKYTEIESLPDDTRRKERSLITRKIYDETLSEIEKRRLLYANITPIPKILV